MFKLCTKLFILILAGSFVVKVALADKVMNCQSDSYKLDKRFLKKPIFSKRVKGEWVNVETLIFKELSCKEEDRTYDKKFCKKTKTSIHCEYEYTCTWNFPEPKPEKCGDDYNPYSLNSNKLCLEKKYRINNEFFWDYHKTAIKNYEKLKSGSWTLDFETNRMNWLNCVPQ